MKFIWNFHLSVSYFSSCLFLRHELSRPLMLFACGNCGHLKGKWDNHPWCISCSICSRSASCSICSLWSEEIWKLAEKRRLYSTIRSVMTQRRKNKKNKKMILSDLSDTTSVDGSTAPHGCQGQDPSGWQPFGWWFIPGAVHQSPVKQSRQPVTSHPVTSQPVTSHPVTPVTGQPITPVIGHPVTSNQSPVNQSPINQAPVIQALVNQAPVTGHLPLSINRQSLGYMHPVIILTLHQLAIMVLQIVSAD